MRKESRNKDSAESIGQGPFQSLGRLILASRSPRRRAYLLELGLDFEAIAADVAEEPRPGESPPAFVLRAAGEKAGIIAGLYPEAWVLGADTAVVVDNDILGKPADAAEALAMLKRLAGRWHEVVTGFHLCRGKGRETAGQAVRTEVRFASFDEETARAYVRTGEPLDKAGAYGIQGQGGFLVAEIRGSYSNVVGLPLAELVAELLRLGIIAPRHWSIG